MSETDAEVQDDVTVETDAKPVEQESADDGAKTLGDGGAAQKDVAAPADWPEDWRTKLAGEDEKLAKRLERMQSPQDVLKAWRSLEQKQSSGELKAVLPEGASDEEIAAYREANGIPAEPKGYLDSLPSGVVIGENDQALVDSFLADAHGSNASPEFVGKAIDWFYSTQEQRVAELHKTDNEFKAGSEEALRSEWGADFDTNLMVFENFIDQAPAGVRDHILKGRLADGSVIGNNPDFLKWIVGVARESNPSATVVPAAGAKGVEGVREEIAKIEGLMRTNRSAYNKDTAMQERYKQLLEAEEKLSARAA